MKIVFIQPNVGFKGHTWEAIGIGYLISYLKNNFKGALNIDFYSAFYDSDETILNNSNDADIICFSCTSPQFKHGLNLAKQLKKENNLIVFGGPHASNLPQAVIKEDCIDIAVQGEGERAMLKIVEDFSSGIRIKKKVINLGYIEDIDSIPFPDRHAIKNERNIETAYKDNNLRITSILSSRGCPFMCSFCASHCVWGRKPRLRSPENIMAELENLVDEWKINFIKFADDTFTINKKRAIDFCKLKIEKNISVPYGLNAHINTIDEELLKYLAESGCQEIWYGVESGSPKILGDMHKFTKIDKIKEVFKLTKKYGIKTRAYFLLGMPNETIEDIKMTEDLADEIQAEIVGFTLLAPYPANEHFDPKIMEDWDWSAFDEYNNDWVKTKTLTNARLKAEQKRLVLKYKKQITFRQKDDKKMEIPLFKIYHDAKDVENVKNVIERGKFWAGGTTIDEFEEEIAKYMGKKYCVAFNSGTSALHAALIAYGIKEGDEVIVPSFTFISTANTPLFVNAKTVFADIEEETFGLDPESVRKKITEKTKMIIPIHYAGSLCKIEELKKIADENKIILIEDAAEAFGARINDKKVGTFGDSAMLSFCQNKIITTGEGGAMVTDSKYIYEKLKLVRSHGRQEDPNYKGTPEYLDHITLGYNFRMPDMVAALGLSQIKKTEKVIDMRRKNAEIYAEKLKGVNEISVLTPPRDYFHVYQLYTVLVKGGKEVRDDLIKYLDTKGVMSKVYFSPAHLTRFYRNEFRYKEGDLPVTEKISEHALTLPMFPELKEEEINYVVEAIEDFFKKI
jgi:perosamine synthetase